MIVNIEVKDVLCKDGASSVPSKGIYLSYVGDDGEISFLTYAIPSDQMYQWVYAGRGGGDAAYVSWDNKPVKKIPSKSISESRIYQMLMDMNRNGALDPIYKLNFPSTAFCDIEVDVDESGFPVPEKAAQQVNCISWVRGNVVTSFSLTNFTKDEQDAIQAKITEYCKAFDTNYSFVYKRYDNERSMLTDFLFNYVRPQPAVTGWNFWFDWQYIINRCGMQLGIDVTDVAPTKAWKNYKLKSKFAKSETKIPVPLHKVIYDYLEIYAKWDQSVEVKENNTLDFVAETVLGVKKVAHNEGFSDMWRNHTAEYIFYNCVDSILVSEIDRKIETSHIFFALANLTHVELMKTLSPVQTLHVVEGEYLYKESKVVPRVGRDESDDDVGYEGAFVYDPKPGVYTATMALDFASLYPTTMRQFNMSPDTFVCKNADYKPSGNEIKTVSGAVYRRDVEGLMPKILADFYAKRKEYKKKMKADIQEKADLESILEKRTKAAKDISDR